LGEDGQPVEDPYCYRDERTIQSLESAHLKCNPERLRALTGVQQLRINTIYQLHADVLAGLERDRPWLNLPEYILARWGAERVAELTNATHTQLVDLNRPAWCREIFNAVGLDPAAAPRIVPPGTQIGRLRGPLAEMPALRDAVLIAPACHDTASAIAGISATGDDWAYISSGTWSLVGTVLEQPCNSPGACAENFTNFAGAGGRICFHKNVNGMWLLRQCMEQWASEGRAWTVQDLVGGAEDAALPEGLINVDEPDLLLPGKMPARINAQRAVRGLPLLDERAANAPQFALLIFHSLAARYAEVLACLGELCKKDLKRLFVIGGGSQNELLNRLTAVATGLRVYPGSPESSTIGNFAIQLAALEGDRNTAIGVSAEAVAHWAAIVNSTASYFPAQK
jgi:rhamnulokinase